MLFLRMQFLPHYRKNYSKSVRDMLHNRKQLHNRRSQYYSVTYHPESGNKLPFFVKYPKIADYFEEVHEKHPWANHRSGVLNGMYLIPHKATKDGLTINDAIFGKTNITEEFFDTKIYKLIEGSMCLMYEKLEVVRNRQLVLRNQTTNFAQDEELEVLGMYIYNT